MKRMLIAGLAAAMMLNSGCTLVHNSMRESDKISKWNPVEAVKAATKGDEEPAPPQTMAAIWNFGVYEKPGSPSVRGLGGRIYFYDAENNAVPAHGELTVYGFDEDSENKTRPDKKFVFRDSEFQSHFSESALGGSYSVWIPWDKVGGYRKSVVLIPVFRTADGRTLRSGQSINLLAGKVAKTSDANSDEPYKVLGSSSAVFGQPSGDKNRTAPKNGVTRASFDESNDEFDDNPNGEFRQRVRTTAIPLTPNLQRQIELSKQIRAGKKVFSQDPPQAKVSVQQPALQPIKPKASETGRDAGDTESSKSRPKFVSPYAARTSTKSGVFGAPGSLR